MDEIFASVWFGMVFGFGGSFLLLGKSKSLSRKGSQRAAGTFLILSRVWLLVPILYALPFLMKSFGFMGIFFVVPGWSVGVENLVYDLAGASISEFIGLNKTNSSLGWTEIAWSIGGLIVLSVIMIISRVDEKE
jgi:hypothetical protein